MGFSLNKQEKLKRKKHIENLFLNGKSVLVFPLRMVYLPLEHDGNSMVRCGFGVSKRKFNSAVDRNRIKRLMREAYRLQKDQIFQELTEKHVIMINYIDEKEPNYVQIEEKLIHLLIKFMKKVKN